MTHTQRPSADDGTTNTSLDRAQMKIQPRRVVTEQDPLRVLLVEDSEIVLLRLEFLIRNLNHPIRVVSATNGDDALRTFRELQPDVVVLDIALTGTSGFDLLATFKVTQPACVIGMLSAHADPEFRENATRLGADFFFSKMREFECVPHLLAALTQPSANS